MDFTTSVNVASLVTLILTVFRLITVEGQVTTPNNKTVTVGDIATIPCTFDQTQLVALTWKKGIDVENSETVVRYFKQRVFPGADERYNISADFSLVLTDTRQNDSDIYWCQVTLTGIFQSATNLTVIPAKWVPTYTTVASSESSVQPITTQRPSTGKAAAPTKKEPAKLQSVDYIPVIIGCSIGGLILLALVVLACYCCFCKRKSPKGYSSPSKPV